MRGTPLFIKKSRVFSALLVMILSFGITVCPNDDALAVTDPADQAKLPSPSSTAQRLYSSAKNDLLKLRILLRNGRVQSTVGSGFLMGASNLVVTNYHVVSRMALEPDTYVGEYVDTRGKSGMVELLAVDALHDLAVVRIDRKGSGFFKMPEQLLALKQGEYLYSLGNPLDLGFAISEGAYNGIIRRGFYDQLMFTGPINAGMSGGPCITVDGQVAGVNVSKRLDGELVSFLVPVRYVQELLKKATSSQKPPKDFNKIVGQQLLAHQAVMVDQLLAGPLSVKTLGSYLVPIRESDQMRCWGHSTDKPEKMYTVEQIRCSMESSIFVSNDLQTGHMSINHEFTRSTRLGALRFSGLTAKAFKRETFGNHKDRRLTGPACTEQFVANKDLPMRAVLCVRAYRKFSGLYDFAVLTSTTDENLINLHSRMDISGVSYENGLRVSRIFLESISREKKP